MALTTINVGSVANDGTGESLRSAFQKTNTAFAAVDGLGTTKADATTAVLASWDASAGTFPSGSIAGKRYRVTVSGVVNSIAFAVDDVINALVASASTTVYAANWALERHNFTGSTDLIDDYIEDVPNGTVYTTDGGTDETFVPAFRENGAVGGVRLGAAAYLGTAAETGATTISTATYTIQPEDYGLRLYLTHATPAITIAAQATEAYGTGFHCLIYSNSTYTITCASGVDGNNVTAETFSGAAMPGCAMLDRIASNDWAVLGGVTAT